MILAKGRCRCKRISGSPGIPSPRCCLRPAWLRARRGPAIARRRGRLRRARGTPVAPGRPPAAARSYETAARSAVEGARTPFWLAAANQWLQARTSGRRAALVNVTEPLSATDTRERLRLDIEIALARGEHGTRSRAVARHFGGRRRDARDACARAIRKPEDRGRRFEPHRARPAAHQRR